MGNSFEDLDLDRLRRRRSEKWRLHPPDVLPAFIAEMDYDLAEPVLATLRSAIDLSDCGYAHPWGLGEAFARFAAARLSARGVADPPWAATLGSPTVGECWHYADVGGRQESLTMTFSYGDRQHAVCVLIDHGRGGKIRDTWVAKATGLRAETEQAARDDPRVVFEMIDAADAGRRLERAVGAGEGPEQPDQVDDVVAHRALLRVRLKLLLNTGTQ